MSKPMHDALDELDEEVQESSGTFAYTFKRPFVHDGRTLETLHFDYTTLTGRDSNAVEGELRRRGVMIVTAESTPEYWAGMAVRACTDRDGDGRRILDQKAMEAMPAPDYKRICNNIRAFFMLGG